MQGIASGRSVGKNQLARLYRAAVLAFADSVTSELLQSPGIDERKICILEMRSIAGSQSCVLRECYPRDHGIAEINRAACSVPLRHEITCCYRSRRVKGRDSLAHFVEKFFKPFGQQSASPSGGQNL